MTCGNLVAALTVSEPELFCLNEFVYIYCRIVLLVSVLHKTSHYISRSEEEDQSAVSYQDIGRYVNGHNFAIIISSLAIRVRLRSLFALVDTCLSSPVPKCLRFLGSAAISKMFRSVDFVRPIVQFQVS